MAKVEAIKKVEAPDIKNNVKITFTEYVFLDDQERSANKVVEFNDIKAYQATAFADVAVFVVQLKNDSQFIYKMSDIVEINIFTNKE